MYERIYKETYYESNGNEHEFEVFKHDFENCAPYTIMLDSAFYATAESGREIADEIEACASWYGWEQYYSYFIIKK